MSKEVGWEYLDYFNDEIDLLIILIMLELRIYEDSKKFSWFPLDDLINTDFFEIDRVKKSFEEDGSYDKSGDIVFDALDFISNDLRFYNIDGVRIKNIYNLTRDLLKKALVKSPEDITNDYIFYYSDLLEKAHKLQNLYRDKIDEIDKKEVNTNNLVTFDSLEIKDRHIYQCVIEELPENVYLSGNFNDKEIKKTQENLELFLKHFIKDEIVDHTGKSFSQQIISFQKYVSKLSEVNNVINVPFESLKEDGFSIIKILKSLEMIKIIKPVIWGKKNTTYWKLDFINKDKNLSEIINSKTEDNTSEVNDSKLITYNKKTGIGSYKGHKFKFKKDTDQYYLFNELYEKMNKSISRYDVLVIIGFYEEGDTPDKSRKSLETNRINNITKNIRKKVGLNPETLVQNSGTLALIGEK